LYLCTGTAFVDKRPETLVAKIENIFNYDSLIKFRKNNTNKLTAAFASLNCMM